MAIHILANAEQIGTQTVSPKDYLIYAKADDGGAEPWVVDQIDDDQGLIRKRLGVVSSKSNALTFALAHQSTGWEDDGVLCRVARDVVRYCSLPGFSDALHRLALAVNATIARRPRALVVVEHGAARVHSSPSVDAVVVDLDARRDTPRSELLPLHTDFCELLADAGVDWPLSSSGRICEPARRKHA